jgi:hypothetical protein
MISIRLPWRPRARPSATLHEIPDCSKRANLGGYATGVLAGLSSGYEPFCYLLFAAASSLRIFAIVPADESLRFLFFTRRFGLVE